MKKWITILFGAILAGAGITVYILFFKDLPASLRVTAEDLKKEDFLSDKKAVLYLSTTAEQEKGGSGLSYAVFIDQEGRIKSMKMGGLELGGIAFSGDSLFLEDQKKVRIIGEEYYEFPMAKEQHTGERTGYLEGQDIFYSIYNSGFSKRETGTYDSDIRYGNEEKIETDSIPYYIAASGQNGDAVDFLSQDQETGKLHLRKLLFNKQTELSDISAIETMEGYYAQGISPVLFDGSSYYFLLQESADDSDEAVNLYRISASGKEQHTYPFIDYSGLSDRRAAYPFNIKNSAALYNGKFYYIDGLGDVHSFNPSSEEIKKEFTIRNPAKTPVRHFEETFFQDGSLYVTRYEENKENSYSLEEYSLADGKLTSSLELKGLDQLISSIRLKWVASYDLKILQ